MGRDVLAERFDNRSLQRRLRVKEQIVDPLAAAAGSNPSGVLQEGKMPGDLGLRGLQRFRQVAHAELPVAQQVDDAQTGGVGQGFECFGDFFHGPNISALADVSRRQKILCRSGVPE